MSGSGSCPECDIPLRRTNFRLQLFEDAIIDKEVEIRRRILKAGSRIRNPDLAWKFFCSGSGTFDADPKSSLKWIWCLPVDCAGLYYCAVRAVFSHQQLVNRKSHGAVNILCVHTHRTIQSWDRGVGFVLKQVTQTRGVIFIVAPINPPQAHEQAALLV